MRLVLALGFASVLFAQPEPLQFWHLATTDDGSLFYFSSPSHLLGTGAVTVPKIFVFDGQTLRLFAQDSVTLGWTSASGDGKTVAFSGRQGAVDNSFQANLASENGSVFWTTAGQAAISRNGRFALFAPGGGTVMTVDLTTGSGFTIPVDGTLPVMPGGRAVASDGTAVVRGWQEIQVISGGSVQKYPVPDTPQSADIDDSAATVVYEAHDEAIVLDLASGAQTSFAGKRPLLTSDGQRLLYLAPDAAGADQAWIAQRDGLGAHQLTFGASGIAEAVIAGDGSIAYAVSGTMQVLRIDISSGVVRDITGDIMAAANPRPRVASFSVSPTTIGPGGAASLCYDVANAVVISIQPGFGRVAGPSGCLAVNPAVTTTYTLSASSAGASVTATATLTVAGNVQIASFTNDPPFSTAAGNPVTLSWTTSNAVSVTVTGTGVPAGTLPVNGSVLVKPVTNTSYTLIAYGANGQAVSAVLYVFVR